MTSAPFRFALGLAAVWWIALVTLVLYASNPVTLNAVQLKIADAIVTARLVDPAAGKLDVDKEWTGRRGIETLQLDPQLFADAPAESTWLIPLSRTAEDRYQVTQAVIKNSRGESVVQPPYVYRWNDDSQEQLEAFLARK
ncbi:MAG: hypothetical protein WEB58_05700 [Planctomycetaceae bacterium]